MNSHDEDNISMFNKMTSLHDDYKEQRTFCLYESMFQFLSQNQSVTFMIVSGPASHAIMHSYTSKLVTQHDQTTALSANVLNMQSVDFISHLSELPMIILIETSFNHHSI